MHIAVLDDDTVFADTLARRLHKRGYQAHAFYSIEALLASQQTWQCLLLDMNLGTRSSIPVIPQLKQIWPEAEIIVLTGYASIASTVAAIKNGADDYLPKPLDFAALLAKINQQPTAADPEQTLSTAQLEWEHIQRVLEEHNGNVSASARALNMHRRTLQRKLQKKPQWG